MSAWLCAFLAVSSARAVPVSIVATNDLHGRVERTAALAGHLKNLRATVGAARGGVVLVDAGDMFQGTLESNLGEGRTVIDAYNALGYAAAAIGNHEFDFGPAGPAVTARGVEDDPRGALKARARQARFPLLAANIIDDATGLPVGWPNVKPSTLVTIGRGKEAFAVGVIGVTTIDTPRTTLAGNVRGLRFAALEDTVEREARALRANGARVVVVAAHAGGKCNEELIGPPFTDTSSCDGEAEVMRLARALPAGLVDVIAAGHTHQAMAHVVAGIPIVEAWANGRGFSRVDFDVDVSSGAVKLVEVHAPQRLCGGKQHDDASIAACAPGAYAGRDVKVDRQLLRTLGPALAEARRQRERKLGVLVDDELRRGYDKESPLGNLFADLMRDAMPGADVTLMNGGGIRGDFAPGPLTYGAVFEMMPFDNRFATVKLSGAELRAVLARNLSATKKGGVFSVGGARLLVACTAGQATVRLTHEDGRPIADDDVLTLVTTDFVALGGDGGLGVANDRVVVDESDPVREHLVRALQKRGGHLSATMFLRDDNARIRTDGQTTARCVP